MTSANPGEARRGCAARARIFRLLLGMTVGAIATARGAEPAFTGQLTLRGSSGWATADSAYRDGNDNPLWDDSGNLRLVFTDSWAPDWRIEIHNDLGFAQGDVQSAAGSIAPLTFAGAPAGAPDDSRRPMRLTRVFDRTGRGFGYDRLDRLNLRWTPDWGSVTIGRAAVTWGNGLIFNVQDLFNPFDPRDVERNYKTGDDLLLVETRAGPNTWQFLAVPRRDPATGRVSPDQSSFAVHGQIPGGGADWTVLAASHYHEWVAGAGRVVTVGSAVWRSDILLTRLEGGGTALAAVTNVDYSWNWAGRNCYGLVEAYYNSLGASDPRGALQDPDLDRRLARGELFTLGRAYVAGSLQVELHPLLHATASAIVDLQGPSAVLQPRLVWDVRRNLQLTVGAQLGAGARGTEFGGPADPETGLLLQPPQTLFLWLDAWF